MSAPSNSRVRRSNAGSPGSFGGGGSSCRLHPIRATVPYQLLRAGQSSPTRSLLGGATTSRGSSPTAGPQLSAGSAGVKQSLSPENREASCPPDSPLSKGKPPHSRFTCARPGSARCVCLVAELYLLHFGFCYHQILFVILAQMWPLPLTFYLFRLPSIFSLIMMWTCCPLVHGDFNKHFCDCTNGTEGQGLPIQRPYELIMMVEDPGELIWRHKRRNIFIRLLLLYGDEIILSV